MAEIGRDDGVVTVFSPHTTAAMTINENADPDVQADLVAWLARLVPQTRELSGTPKGTATPISRRASLGPSVQVPLVGGRLLLGRWQGHLLLRV